MSFIYHTISSDDGQFKIEYQGGDIILVIDTPQYSAYWDNSDYLVKEMWEDLSNHIIFQHRLKDAVLRQFDHSQLVELYGMMLQAEALGWCRCQ